MSIHKTKDDKGSKKVDARMWREKSGKKVSHEDIQARVSNEKDKDIFVTITAAAEVSKTVETMKSNEIGKGAGTLKVVEAETCRELQKTNVKVVEAEMCGELQKRNVLVDGLSKCSADVEKLPAPVLDSDDKNSAAVADFTQDVTPTSIVDFTPGKDKINDAGEIFSLVVPANKDFSNQDLYASMATTTQSDIHAAADGGKFSVSLNSSKGTSNFKEVSMATIQENLEVANLGGGNPNQILERINHSTATVILGTPTLGNINRSYTNDFPALSHSNNKSKKKEKQYHLAQEKINRKLAEDAIAKVVTNMQKDKQDGILQIRHNHEDNRDLADLEMSKSTQKLQ